MKKIIILCVIGISLVFYSCNTKPNNNNTVDPNEEIGNNFIIKIDSSINMLDAILINIDSLDSADDSLEIVKYIGMIDNEIKIAQQISDSIYYFYSRTDIEIPYELVNMQEEYTIRIIAANQSIIYIYDRFGEINCVKEKLSFKN